MAIFERLLGVRSFHKLKREKQLTAHPIARMLLEAELLAVRGCCAGRLGSTTAELAAAEQHIRHAVVVYAQVRAGPSSSLPPSLRPPPSLSLSLAPFLAPSSTRWLARLSFGGA